MRPGPLGQAHAIERTRRSFGSVRGEAASLSTVLKLRWYVLSTMIRTSAPTRRTTVSGTTMKALVLRRHGGLADLEVVTDYPVPRATEGHVVVRVRASSFNYHDVFTLRGMPGIKVP